MLLTLKLLSSNPYFGSPMRFERLGDNQNVTVTLRSPENEEQEQGVGNQTVCEATADLQPRERALETFEALWQGKIPSGVDLSDVPESIRSSWTPGYFEKYEIPLSRLSASAQDFVRHSLKTLVEAIQHVLATTCWRTGEPCALQLHRHGRMRWSLDGSSWRMAPANFVVWDERPAFLHDTLRDEIDEVLREDLREPLGQELFREAWAQKYSNPRSSLAIGISALEAGIKELIADLIPHAAWLARHAPTPPVYDILNDYLPKLPVKETINGRVLVPPQQLDTIRKWVGRRNRMVHGNPESVEPDDLKELLLVVRDVLWLLDYYRGSKWAIDYLRTQTREALGIPAAIDQPS
ncbi:MAG: hypothetical protein ACREBG_22160 [Pyrinomonadaceae bacterium]